MLKKQERQLEFTKARLNYYQDMMYEAEDALRVASTFKKGNLDQENARHKLKLEEWREKFAIL